MLKDKSIIQASSIVYKQSSVANNSSDSLINRIIQATKSAFSIISSSSSLLSSASSSQKTISETENFIFVEKVSNYASEILRHLHENTSVASLLSSIMIESNLVKFVRKTWPLITAEEEKFLLFWLEVNHKIYPVIFPEENIKVYCTAGKPKNEAQKSLIENYAQLLIYVQGTNSQILSLETQQLEARKKAKSFLVSESNKSMAVVYLQKSKKIQKTIDKYQSTLFTLEEMLHSIEKSELNQKVAKSMITGLECVKKYSQETLAISQRINDLKEEIQEIDQSPLISDALHLEESVDDFELKKELDAIVCEDDDYLVILSNRIANLSVDSISDRAPDQDSLQQYCGRKSLVVG